MLGESDNDVDIVPILRSLRHAEKGDYFQSRKKCSSLPKNILTVKKEIVMKPQREGQLWIVIVS